MNLKTIIYRLMLTIAVVAFVSCNDTLDKLGMTIQPEGDRVTVGADTLLLTAKTVKVDSVFSKTKYPILGEYLDPVFGNVKSDYIGEFYYPDDHGFKKDAKIDSVMLTVSYTSILGDSLAPMELAVYGVKERLPRGVKYTNFDPKALADMSAPLGSRIFTGRNNTYRTETYQSGMQTEEIKIYEINAVLPKALGQSFLDEYLKPDHGALKNNDTFAEFFPGLYVTTSFGNSTVLNVNLTSLRVFYKYLDEKGSSQKTDTIRSTEWRLNITPEVTQINYVEGNVDSMLGDDSDGTYVKSPAGANTELFFPLSQLSGILDNSALNQAKMRVYALTDVVENEQVKLHPPRNLLMVHKDSLTSFFEKRQLPNSVTSFMATFDANTYSYDFGNVSSLINYYNKQHREDNTKPLDQTFVLVPVDVSSSMSGGSMYYPGTEEVTDVYNQMMPAAVKLDNGEKRLRLDIIYSSFEK